jgi:hypothetical protein
MVSIAEFVTRRPCTTPSRAPRSHCTGGIHGGSSPDAEVALYWKEYYKEGLKCLQAMCLRCGHIRAKNTTRQREHLRDHCPNYI